MSKARRESTSLEGWNEIAHSVAAHTGLRVSARAVKRWADRENDPLPTRRWLAGRRVRILADPVAVKTWCDRQWRTPGHTSSSPSGEIK